MTLADLQRRIDALGLQSFTVKMPPSGGYLVSGVLRDGGEHKAWIQPGKVDDAELLETTVEVFLRGAETRARQLSNIRCAACGARCVDQIRCASCGQERAP